MFDKLIEPLSFDEFATNYWDKKYLYRDGRRDRSFDAIISVEDIDEFLSRTDIRYPSLRLVRNGEELPLHEYTRELKLGPHVSNDLIDNEKMFHHFNSGATIVLQFLQNNIPRFGKFTNGLEEAFGCNVHGSCFITPPNSQGFTSHYDTYSFFVLQILGDKSWNIYPPTELQPVREDRVGEKSWVPCDPVAELELKAGDFLYVPRGVFHAAKTASSVSIHMSLGFFLPTWLDIVNSAFSRLRSSKLLRQIPPGIGGEVAAEDAKKIKDFLAENLDLVSGLQTLKEDYFSRRVDGRRNRLLDLAALPALNAQTRVLIQPHLPYRVEAAGSRISLSFSDKKLTLPEAAHEVILFLKRNGASPVSAVCDSIEMESRLLLIRTLIEEGFLTIWRAEL